MLHGALGFAMLYHMTNTESPAILANRARCLRLGLGYTWSGHPADSRMTHPIKFGAVIVGRVDHDSRDGWSFVYRVGHSDAVVTLQGAPADALNTARDLIAPHLI